MSLKRQLQIIFNEQFMTHVNKHAQEWLIRCISKEYADSHTLNGSVYALGDLMVGEILDFHADNNMHFSRYSPGMPIARSGVCRYAK